MLCLLVLKRMQLSIRFPVFLLAFFAGCFFVLDSAKMHHLVFYGLLLAGLFQYRLQLLTGGREAAPLLVMAAYILWQAISLSWSPVWSGEELGEVLRKGLLSFIWVLLVMSLLAKEAERRLFWEVAVVMAATSALLAIFWHIPPARMTGLGRSLNPVQGGSLYGWALVGAAWIWLREKKIFWSFCIAILLLGLLATQSRAALLAALISISLLAAVELRAFSVKNIKYAVVIAVIPLLLVALDWQQLIARSDSFRLQIWQEALTHWQQHPLLGLGYRAPFEVVLPYGAAISQPHSIYVTALYYGGIAGFAILLLMFGFAVQRAWIRRDILALALLAYGMILGLVDYNLLLVNSGIEWLVFWLPIGLAFRKHYADPA